MRRGTIRRRCATCGLGVQGQSKVCRSGHARVVWTFSVDVALPGAPRRRVTRSGFATKGEAVAAMSEIQVDGSRGTRVEPSKLTMESYLAEWVEGLQLEEATVSWYRSNVENHIIPALGSVPIQQVTVGMVERFLADKAKGGRLDGKPGGLGPRSLRGLAVTLHKALDAAVRRRLIPHNPMDLAEKPRVPKVDVTEATWTPDILSEFLRSTRETPLGAMWHVLAMTGLRRSEVCALKWSDIDLDARVIEVRRARTVVDGQVVTKGPKTATSRRTVELESSTIEALRALRRIQAAERLAAGEAWADQGWVFCDPLGAPLHPQNVTRVLQRTVKALGLPPTDVKGLRHAHATAMLRAGVHPKVVQERLGHSSISITMDIYSSVVPGMQREGVEKLAEMLGS